MRKRFGPHTSSAAGVVTVLALTALALVLWTDIGARRLEATWYGGEAERVRSVVDGTLDDLSRTDRDWATWDHAASFVDHPDDAQFIADTLTPTQFRNLNLRTVVFAPLSGPPAWGRALGASGETLDPLAPGLWDDLRSALNLATPLGADEDRHAMLAAGGHVFAVAAHAILPSSGRGPSTGTLVMARTFDGPALDALALRMGHRVTFMSVADPDLPPDVRDGLGALAAGAPTFITPCPDGQLAAVGLFRDAQGRPSVIMRFVGERWIVAWARVAQGLMLGGLTLAAVLLVLLVRRQLRRAVAGEDPLSAGALAQVFVDQSNDGVILVDRVNGAILRTNDAARRALGTRSPAESSAWLSGLLNGFVIAPGEARIGPKEVVLPPVPGAAGIPLELEVSAQPIVRGAETVLCVVMRDVSERKRVEQHIRHQAYHDTLTQLPNRQLFNDRLAMALAQARRSTECLGVLLIDLDHFKTINDTMGHDMGDELLVQAAERLRKCVRDCDTIARLGGDEFIVLLPRLELQSGAGTVAERILNALRQPFRLNDREVHLGCSVGVAVHPQDGNDPSTLFRNADLAMYHAKQQGRNAWVLHDPSMNEQAADMLELKTELLHALRDDELFLEYQPQVESVTGRLIGFEALVRWRSPKRGIVPPIRFIPVAEETGQIVAIGDWVLRAACKQIRTWMDQGLPPVRVAVNFSARQFLERDLVETVQRILEETGCPADLIEVEVTESIAMKHADRSVAALKRFREMGMGVALDDFGTGYSSLAYLRQFPLQRLKIDRAFIREIAESDNSRTMVDAIVGLAHSLDLEVCAEGVETPAQIALLRTLACDVLQGYGLARPMPAPDATDLLRQGVVLRWAEHFAHPAATPVPLPRQPSALRHVH